MQRRDECVHNSLRGRITTKANNYFYDKKVRPRIESMVDVKEKIRYLTEAEKLALDEVIKALRKKWASAKSKLFGSKATGTFEEESDLDLLILLPCKVTKSIREQITEKVF